MIRLAALAAAVLLAAACGPGEGQPVATPTPEEAETTPASPDPAGEETPTAEPEEAASPEATEPAAPSRPLSAEDWTALGDAPQPLTEVAAAPLSGAVWTAGGLAASGEAVDAVQVYDPTFDLWEDGPSLPEPVHHAALVSTGDGLLLVGGYAGSGFSDPTDAVHRLDPATGAWEPGPPLPSPRAAGAAAWDGSRVVYGGGVGPGGLAGDVFALTGDAWESIGALPQPREHLAAASDGQGRVWFLAGRTGGLDTNLTAVDLVEGDRVETVGDVPTARGGVAGFHHPEAGACVAGGEEPQGTFDEVECVDAAGAVSTLPPLAVARHGLGAAVVDGIVYVVLGGPDPGLAVSAVAEALLLE